MTLSVVSLSGIVSLRWKQVEALDTWDVAIAKKKEEALNTPLGIFEKKVFPCLLHLVFGSSRLANSYVYCKNDIIVKIHYCTNVLLRIYSSMGNCFTNAMHVNMVN